MIGLFTFAVVIDARVGPTKIKMSSHLTGPGDSSLVGTFHFGNVCASLGVFQQF